MSLEHLALKYIGSADTVLKQVQITEKSIRQSAESIGNVIQQAKAYLEDAKYYKGKKRFEVSLASVAYCEGLLDALKLLGAVKFEWPKKAMVRKEK